MTLFGTSNIIDRQYLLIDVHKACIILDMEILARVECNGVIYEVFF